MILRAAATLVMIVLIAACQPSASTPLLSDPREVLNRTVGSVMAMRSVHLRGEFVTRFAGGGELANDEWGGWAEVDVDIASGELGGVAASIDGTGRASFILADGAAFSQSAPNGRWTKVPMPGGAGAFPGMFLGMGGVGDPPDVPKIVAAALADPATTLELRGVEDCATGKCYRLAIALTPATIVRMSLDLTNMDEQGFVSEEELLAQGVVPGLTLEVVSDTASLRLLEIQTSATLQGTSTSMRLILSRHDEPVSIQPPPPELVDSPNFGPIFQGGGGVVVETMVPAEPPAP